MLDNSSTAYLVLKSSFLLHFSAHFWKLWNLEKHPTVGSVGVYPLGFGYWKPSQMKTSFWSCNFTCIKIGTQVKKSLTYLYLVIYCEDFKPIVVNGSKQFSNFWNRLFISLGVLVKFELAHYLRNFYRYLQYMVGGSTTGDGCWNKFGISKLTRLDLKRVVLYPLFKWVLCSDMVQQVPFMVLDVLIPVTSHS